ncbi:Glycosyltransferase [Reinekea sp. MED297]|uniref:Glycosyltransferase n=2 Tax=Reinekea TaxID=230494 RepID=A4B945_9GAMM|nr:Glycosyltransferase [Reinekea sp. MED297] [Reinekea blandensis MED297]
MVPYPPKAGLLNRSYNIIRELSEIYDIDLYCLNQENLITPYFDSFEQGLTKAKDELSKYCSSLYIEPDPVRVSSFSKMILTFKSLFSTKPYSTEWLNRKSFANQIKAIRDSQDYDYIYVDSISLISNVESQRYTHEKLILGHHNIESEMIRRRSERTKNLLLKFIFYIEYLKLKRLERIASLEFDRQIVCSAEDSELLGISTGYRDHFVVPNGFDFRLLDGFCRAPKLNHLLFIGTMDWYPNVDAVRYFLNEVWPNLKQQRPEVIIDVIGSKPPADLVELSKSDPSVKIRGFVQDIEPYLAQASVFVCPIRDGGGTKLKLIEAFAHKIPCVVDPISCEGIKVDDRHVKFAQNPDAFVEGIKALLDNRKMADQMSERAYQIAEAQYSYKVIADVFSQSLESMETEECVA